MKVSAWYKAARQAPASPYSRGRCHSRDEAPVLVSVENVTAGKSNGRQFSQKMSQLAGAWRRHLSKRCHGQGEAGIVIFVKDVTPACCV